METLLFILVVVNAGGEGKTTVATLIRIIFFLYGREMLALDGDAGNLALKNRYNEDLLTKVVGWGVGPETVPEIVKAASSLSVVFDLGANSMASKREISELVPVLRSKFAEEGYRTIALMPISPNKQGASGALERLAGKLQGFEICLVRNDRDGSGEFEPVSLAGPCIELPHLQPGLQAYLTRSKRPILDAILYPELGYTRAAQFFGDWVRSFASDPSTQRLLGRDVCEAAIRQLPQPPTPIRVRLEKADQVTDQRLGDFDRRTIIMDLLDVYGDTPDGLHRAADELERRAAAA